MHTGGGGSNVQIRPNPWWPGTACLGYPPAVPISANSCSVPIGRLRRGGSSSGRLLFVRYAHAQRECPNYGPQGNAGTHPARRYRATGEGAGPGVPWSSALPRACVLYHIRGPWNVGFCKQSGCRRRRRGRQGSTPHQVTPCIFAMDLVQRTGPGNNCGSMTMPAATKERLVVTLSFRMRRPFIM